MRMTRQKRCIREYLEQCYRHPTAEEVWIEVRERMPRISLATVYRRLEQMADEGELLRISPPVGPRRYDTRTHVHPHVICRYCGAVADVEIPADASACLERLTSTVRSPFRLDQLQLTWLGVCPQCRSRRPAPGDSRGEGGSSAPVSYSQNE